MMNASEAKVQGNTAALQWSPESGATALPCPTRYDTTGAQRESHTAPGGRRGLRARASTSHPKPTNRHPKPPAKNDPLREGRALAPRGSRGARRRSEASNLRKAEEVEEK